MNALVKTFSGLQHPRQIVRKAADRLGYDRRNWLRVRQIEAFEAFFRAHSPIGDILEISPGWNDRWKQIPARSYSTADFPDFDICTQTLLQSFDIIIADQVLEHVAEPAQAVRNIRAMLKPGGHALVATPFLFRIHARPHDYVRWTAPGLQVLLIQGGFRPEELTVDAWGNKSCVRAHLGGRVRDYGFGRDMHNDPDYPIMVWAFARKGEAAASGEKGVL